LLQTTYGNFCVGTHIPGSLEVLPARVDFHGDGIAAKRLATQQYVRSGSACEAPCANSII
jgi:hypothetical protein